MSVTLDGQAIFDEQGLAISAGSPVRASQERAIAGLDGVLSIDLPKSAEARKKIKQIPVEGR